MADGDLGKPAVDLREDEGVWRITFNRPKASNAVTLADLDRLSEIFEEGGGRPLAAVFTGAGRTSCSAGMHLKAFSELTPQRAREFIVRIAVPHATFGLPEIKVGVPSVCDIALNRRY